MGVGVGCPAGDGVAVGCPGAVVDVGKGAEPQFIDLAGAAAPQPVP